MANQEKFFVEYGVDTDSTSSFKVPAGTTAQRDSSPESGLFRYNTSNNQFEGYSNGSWGAIGGGSLGQSFDVDTFTGDNSTTAFTLSRSVSSEDYLIVFIDGVFQGQGSYVLSGTTLTLDSPPATGSSIIAYSVVPISVAEIPADTDDLTEGSTNLYFTNARVDSRLSSGSVATIETTGNVTVGGDLSVSGGLTVSGTTTTVNSTTTSVTDSMIELANSNTSSDVIDIGIYGNYDDGLSEGGATEYTGLFRDASDSTWKLFDGLEEEPSTTVNTAGTNYAKAALEVGDLDATTIITTDINLENTGGNAVLDITASNTGLSRVNLGDTDGSTKGGLKYDHSDDSMVFRANGSDQMTLTNTGLAIGSGITPTDDLHIEKTDSVFINLIRTGSGSQLRLGASTAGVGNLIDAEDNTLTIRTSTAEPMIFGTNDTEAMRIDSSQNVGIGTTSPSGEFHVDSGLAACDIHFTTGSTGGTGYDVNLNMTGGANNSEMNLNMGIAGDADREQIKAYQSTIRFITANSERMRIDDSGTVLIGKTTTNSNVEGITLSSNDFVQATRSGGTCFSANRRDSTGTIQNFEYNGGTVGTISVTTSSTSYNTSSDYRLKENIVEMDAAIDRVKLLQPKRFNFIADETDTTVDGFLAHEVQDIVPEAITGVKDEVDGEGNPVYQGIDQSKLVPLLTKAIQEQQTIIEDLRTRIETLENA